MQQEYVSTELTHFVGQQKPESERFGLLVEILRSGWLTYPPHLKRHQASLKIYAKSLPSENVAYQAATVCFCDIPVNQLAIHMGKYSRYGVAFDKAFLVGQGATPVFYISQHSMIWRRKKEFRGHAELETVPASAPEPDPTIDKAKMERSPLGEAMDDVHKMKWALFYERKRLLEAGGLPPAVVEHLKGATTLDMDLTFLVFAFMKMFDASAAVNAPENYYMEREWRMVDNLEFTLGQVARVIVPKGRAQQVAREVPGYQGRVTEV